MTDLSIIIPSRNEMFLDRTIQDILDHMEGDTEIIAVLDGQWAFEPIPQRPNLTLVYFPESIGQRAAMNVAARISTAKYIMKCDAHCAFDQGFDVKMMAEMHDDWTLVPLMKNLHIFNWVCPDGHTRYQSPSGPCTHVDEDGVVCGKPTIMDIIWRPRHRTPNSTSYCFDTEPHFQYFNEYEERPEGKGDITETMSLQGSCFMLTRDKYFELNVADEKFGSWGSQGIEVAVKTWLSGGRVMCNKKTWYAHCFRTQGGDFGFPYRLSGKQVEHAKALSRDLFFNNKWDKQIHPLSWLVEKFWPVRGWKKEDLEKLRLTETRFEPSKSANILTNTKTWGVVYFTDNQLNPEIMSKCQRQLTKRCVDGHELISVSIGNPIKFGQNIYLPDLERGNLTMFKQILAGLEEIDTDYVFFAEHDVLYHPSHFMFVPTNPEIFYYNTNVWKIRYSDSLGLYVDDCRQLSGICAYRELLLDHYRNRVKTVEEKGFTRAMGYEPGTHNGKSEAWKSQWPNIDIRHDHNWTPSRWRKEQFRNQRYTEGWTEIENPNIPGWGHMWHWWKRI